MGGLLSEDLDGLLAAVPADGCSYAEWVSVGMALKSEGLPLAAWDEWSALDAARYVPGECARKWEGFGEGGAGMVGGGTLVRMAMERGYAPEGGEAVALGWDDDVVDAMDGRREGRGRIVDPSWVEAEDIEEPGDGWDGAADLAAYLEALYEPGEVVGYVTQAYPREGGRWAPSGKGDYRRTAGEILESLAKHEGDLDSAIGHPNPESGAWIRFNPLDGQGVRNGNVAEFRYALVESDSMGVGRQLAVMRELELPIAALVHSGNRSLHAIVRVDARDYDEYRRRVDLLYRVCGENGLQLDTQNKNPSRLSRMPGVMRGGRKQWLVATGMGRASWREWREWLDERNDDLPEPEALADVWDAMPELSPPLIEGVLRQGHKLLLAGPSKAGKSFALIGLCAAIAEGGTWLGWKVAQGSVLYVNLELDRASCLHRFRDVYAAMGLRPDHIGNIAIWNLRGRSKPMDELAPSLIRRALRMRPLAVVIDPIYKVITGDENSADQMARFCNQFDRVADALGCAVVYCHHHSKGAQGAKRSMDRASGSGVFARDPDALIDMIELELTEDVRRQQEDAAVLAACEAALDASSPGWRGQVDEDDALVGARLLSQARARLSGDALDSLLASVLEARRRARSRTAWRLEGTLREFPRFEPVDLWFDYPAHEVDRTGVLSDIAAQGSEEAARQKGVERARKRRQGDQAEKVRLMRAAMAACAEDGVAPTRAAVLERIGELNGAPLTKTQLRNWTLESAAWSPIRVAESGKAEGLLEDAEASGMLEGW